MAEETWKGKAGSRETWKKPAEELGFSAARPDQVNYDETGWRLCLAMWHGSAALCRRTGTSRVRHQKRRTGAWAHPARAVQVLTTPGSP